MEPRSEWAGNVFEQKNQVTPRGMRRMRGKKKEKKNKKKESAGRCTLSAFNN
jgi:spore maturation protein SpmA